MISNLYAHIIHILKNDPESPTTRRQFRLPARRCKVEPKPPAHHGKTRNIGIGVTVVVLVAILVLLWEFHGLIYQYFAG